MIFKNATLNNPHAPTAKEIETAVATFSNEDEKQNYLSEVASYDFKCPDACDQWAMNWLNENEK